MNRRRTNRIRRASAPSSRTSKLVTCSAIGLSPHPGAHATALDSRLTQPRPQTDVPVVGRVVRRHGRPHVSQRYVPDRGQPERDDADAEERQRVELRQALPLHGRRPGLCPAPGGQQPAHRRRGPQRPVRGHGERQRLRPRRQQPERRPAARRRPLAVQLHRPGGRHHARPRPGRREQRRRADVRHHRHARHRPGDADDLRRQPGEGAVDQRGRAAVRAAIPRPEPRQRQGEGRRPGHDRRHHAQPRRQLHQRHRDLRPRHRLRFGRRGRLVQRPAAAPPDGPGARHESAGASRRRRLHRLCLGWRYRPVPRLAHRLRREDPEDGHLLQLHPEWRLRGDLAGRRGPLGRVQRRPDPRDRQRYVRRLHHDDPTRRGRAGRGRLRPRFQRDPPDAAVSFAASIPSTGVSSTGLFFNGDTPTDQPLAPTSTSRWPGPASTSRRGPRTPTDRTPSRRPSRTAAPRSPRRSPT